MRCVNVVWGGLLAALVMAFVLVPGGALAGPEPRRPLVVIDPGHGGSNVGAAGVNERVFEKQVTLVLARALARELEARDVRTVLTRDRDTYLSLRRRVAQANELDADVFVSLHANATATAKERGYETFILTPTAADVDTRAIRLGAGRSRAGVNPELGLLLDDVERGAAASGAAELAGAVQDALRGLRGPEGDRGVRQASFDVLMGATMPAVLVEVGFLDHPVEGLELLDPSVRRAMASAIAEAVAGPDGVDARPSSSPPHVIADVDDSI